MRYLITFACYGAHIHGDESGSVDRHHNLFGARVLDADPQRATTERLSMNHPPYELDSASRAVVLAALRDVCEHRGWTLLAAHVRTNHVHVIAEAEVTPERAMSDLKRMRAEPWVASNMPAPVGSDGRVTGAHGGSGRTRRCGKRSATWWNSRANQWLCLSLTSSEYRTPLADARGSVAFTPTMRKWDLKVQHSLLAL